jgi:hypothetical protein
MAGKKIAVEAGSGFENRVWDALKLLIQDSGSLFLREDSGLKHLKSQAKHAASRRGYVFKNGSSEPQGFLCAQNDLYNFLSEMLAGIVSTSKQKKDTKARIQSILSKNMRPDLAFFNLETNVLYIVEMKTQSSEGSVDEKLETVDFKRRQYQKLAAEIGFERVEFNWALDAKFGEKKYKDVMAYLDDMNSLAQVGKVSLELIGLGNLED